MTASWISPESLFEVLTKINIPTGITTINTGTFFNCYNLQEITIPSNVRNIQSEAFYGCTALKSIKFNEGLNYISSGAFYNCYAVSEVVLPSTLTSLTSSSFYRCTNLQTVVLKSPSIVSISSNTFPTSILSIYVHDNLINDYPNYSYWYNYTHCLKPLSEWLNAQ